MYLAPVIDGILESKKSKLVVRQTYFYITGILNRYFAKVEPFTFRYETYSDYSKEDFSVSGLYDMDTNKRYIVLNFPKSYKTFSIDDEKWKEFKFAVSQVCQHEAIHQNQWQHRDYKEEGGLSLDFRNMIGDLDEDREYLSDIDEIDAYGHDIAMEIKYCYPKKDPYEVLRTIDRRRKLWSYTYYKKTFKGEEWSDIKKRLYKKIYLWMPYVTV